LQPCAAKVRAAASPIPLVDPVTNAVLPFNILIPSELQFVILHCGDLLGKICGVD
jgi:hypothetical protein